MASTPFTPFRFASVEPLFDFSIDLPPQKTLSQRLSDFVPAAVDNIQDTAPKRISDGSKLEALELGFGVPEQFKDTSKRNTHHESDEAVAATRITNLHQYFSDGAGNGVDEIRRNGEPDLLPRAINASACDSPPQPKTPSSAAAPRLKRSTPGPSRALTLPRFSTDVSPSKSSQICTIWRIQNLDNIFQIDPGLAPRVWTDQSIDVVYKIAHISDRASAERLMMRVAEKRYQKSKNYAKPRKRFCLGDAQHVLWMLSEESLVNAEQPEDESPPGPEQRQPSSYDRDPVAISPPLRDVPEPHPSEGIADVVGSDLIAHSEGTPLVNNKRRRISREEHIEIAPSPEQTKQSPSVTQAHEGSVGPSCARNDNATTDDSLLHLAKIYPSLQSKKVKLEAAEATSREADAQFQRKEAACNAARAAHKDAKAEAMRADAQHKSAKAAHESAESELNLSAVGREEASEQLRRAQEQHAETKAEVKALMEKVPEDVWADFKTFFNQVDEWKNA